MIGMGVERTAGSSRGDLTRCETSGSRRVGQ
jgi:hypothetical protein